MTDQKLSTNLLQACAAAAEIHMKLSGKVTEAMLIRYGKTHSDIDCDSLIDVLDYHGGDITLAECDRLMAAAGAPKLRQKRKESGGTHDR